MKKEIKTSHEIALNFAEKFQKNYPQEPLIHMMEDLRIEIEAYASATKPNLEEIKTLQQAVESKAKEMHGVPCMSLGLSGRLTVMEAVATELAASQFKSSAPDTKVEKPDFEAESFYNQNYSGAKISEFLKPYVINTYKSARKISEARIKELEEALTESVAVVEAMASGKLIENLDNVIDG